MDDWFIDPILGFVLPGAGDIITAALTVPFIYTALLRLRSIPLTLAVLANCLIDMLVGMIPVLGDFFDLCYKAHKMNYRLIVGYVEEDPEVLDKVSKNAALSAVLITVLCLLIRLVGAALAWMFK